MVRTKSVDNYDAYEINTMGRVTSYKGKTIKYLKPRNHSNGYLDVVLYNEDGGQLFMIHKLVLCTFDRYPEPGEVCMHLNHIKTDCRLENLRWGTQQENVSMTIRDGRGPVGEDFKCAKLTTPEVISIRRRAVAGEKQCVLASEYSVSDAQISRICNNLRWRHVA